MILRRGEIVLIRIDFRQTLGGKVRPALVLLDTGDEDSSRLRLYRSPETHHSSSSAAMAGGWPQRRFNGSDFTR
jgi:hypothetical protein